MKVFVTGATGRIASLLVGGMIQRKWGIDAFVLPNEDVKTLEDRGMTILRGDITDFASIDNAINKSAPDLIFHLAGYVKLGNLSDKQIEDAMYDVNVNGTKNILESALRHNVNKVIYISSVAIYGPNTNITIINENTIPEMNSNGPYGRTKYLAHQEIIRFQDKGINAIIFIPGIIYGPEFERTTSLIESLHNGNIRYLPDTLINARVPLVFSHDLPQAIFSGIEKDLFGKQYILVESSPYLYDLAALTADMIQSKSKPKPISYRKAIFAAWIAEFVAKITGKNARITQDRIRTLFQQTKDFKYQFEFDNSKAKTELDWKPTVLQTAIEETVKSIASNNKV